MDKSRVCSECGETRWTCVDYRDDDPGVLVVECANGHLANTVNNDEDWDAWSENYEGALLFIPDVTADDIIAQDATALGLTKKDVH